MTSSIYLSGPSSKNLDPTLPISADWKSYATGMFLRSGIIVANPIDLDIGNFIETNDYPSSIDSVQQSLNLIDKADSVLANLTQIIESTMMEIFYAHRQGKQVIVVGSEPFSPWVANHCQARFQKLEMALEYILDQPKRFDSITWATQFESFINKKSEQYPPEGRQDYEYYGGGIPVLVLAPHSTSYFKEGTLYSHESYTGTYSVLLHKLANCHSLITSYCTAADPLYYFNSPYVVFLSQLLKKINFKLVLILSGIEDWSDPHSLIIKSYNNSSLINRNDYLNLLTSMLSVRGFKDIGFDSGDLKDSGKKTLDNLIFEDLQIPTLRIEVHRRYRLPQMQPSLFNDLSTLLAQFAMLIGMK